MMKHITTYLFVLLLSLTAAQAQSSTEVRLEGAMLEVRDSTVVMTMTVEAGRAARNGYDYVLMPVLELDTLKVAFKPVLIEGERGRWRRNREASEQFDGYRMRNKTRLQYMASVGLQWWMESARVVVETWSRGCDGQTRQEKMKLIDQLTLPIVKSEDRGEMQVVMREVVFEPESTADSLSISYSFVIPDAEFDPEDPFKVYDEERDGGMAIYFYLNDTRIDEGYANNKQTLLNLAAAIGAIMNSDNSAITQVVIGGFSSPEGAFEVNDRLAWERAVSIKERLMERTSIPGDNIQLYNGSADWQGLRAMVEDSDMESREQIVRIIDSYPIKDEKSSNVRMDMIKKLDGNMSYRYMFDNFFPLLRNGAFIKIFYKNK